MVIRVIQSLRAKKRLSQPQVLFLVRGYIRFLCFILLAHIVLLFPSVHISRRMMTILAVPIGLLVFITMVVSLVVLQMIIKQFHSLVMPIRRLSNFVGGMDKQFFIEPLPERDSEVAPEVNDLYESIEQMRTRLRDSFQVNQLMFNLAEELQKTLDANEVIRVAVSGLSDIIRCNLCSIIIQSSEHEFEILARYLGKNTELIQKQLQSDDFSVLDIFRSGNIGSYPNWENCRPEGTYASRQYEMGIRSSIHFPVMQNDSVVAVLSLGSLFEYHFTDERVNTIRTLIPLIGIAVQNARVYENYALLASQDGLTNLWNRRYLEQALELTIAELNVSSQILSVVMLDIDQFKQFNDTYGHPEGDRVLQHVSQVLIQGVRPTDLVARYGGEEFVVLMKGLNLKAAHEAAERLRIAIYQEQFGNYSISASFGVTQLVKGDTVSSLIKRADDALYQAKSGGRNCVISLPKVALEIKE